MKKNNIKDLIGEQFNYLTLLSDKPKIVNGRKKFKFHCICGNECFKSLFEVTSGHTKSCGKCGIAQKNKKGRGFKDISGKKFNNLTAIKPVGQDKHKRAIWLFQCDCWNTIEASANNVKSGTTKSCGCKKHRTAPNALNLVGEKFGRLEVVSKYKIDNGIVFWECKCKCGNTIIKNTGSLRSGKTKSCGCLLNDIQSKNSYCNKWAHEVKKLYGKCAKCGKESHLAAHHIYPKAIYPKIKFHYLNGIALCGDCHRSFHHKYGNKCTLENLVEFLEHNAIVSEIAKLLIFSQLNGNMLEDLKKAKFYIEKILALRGEPQADLNQILDEIKKGDDAIDSKIP